MSPPKILSTERSHLSDDDRRRGQGHRGGVLWLTGLSGSGKSTLAYATEQALFEAGRRVAVLDGDNLRHGLCADLGFSAEDRAENIRRAGAVAALFAGAGLICITGFISPYRAGRARAREAIGEGFHEVYLNASVAACEARDPKGLYAKARRGEITGFTGVDDPYEPPSAPELTLDTANESAEFCARLLIDYAEKVFAD